MFFLTKLLKLGEIDGVKFLARKSDGVNFLTNFGKNNHSVKCKTFARSVNFFIFTHFLCFFPLKLLKLGEIDGVKFLA